MYEFAVTPAVTQLRRPGVTVDKIEAGGLGDQLKLEPGDRIVRVNGRAVRDYLDFRFQTAGETEMTFLVRKNDGQSWEIDLERDEGEDFGIDFEQIVPRQCANECIFCFCKGNPEDARPSLFVRDEDIRLSFLYGNYTTLSSITPDEMNRIIEQHLSPQYVSVHATDLKTRAYLLGVDEARADISDKLERLLDNDIEIHAQIVLCPGINDGKILEKSLRDLASHYPKVVSTAIVPVALTRYNKDDRLTRVTPEFCRRVIKQVGKLQDELNQSIGTRFAFLGDEIYIKAGAEIPSREHYGDYPQIEDGVGMVRSFVNEFEELLLAICKQGAVSGEPLSSEFRIQGSELDSNKNVRTHELAIKPLNSDSKPKTQNRKQDRSPLTAHSSHGSLTGTVMTGEMFAPVLKEQIEKLNKLTGSELHVLAVPNTYFGGDVSVAGLLSGQDFVAVKEQVVGDFVIIPEHVIKSDEPVLIDGMRFEELESAFDVPIQPLGLSEFLDRFAI